MRQVILSTLVVCLGCAESGPVVRPTAAVCGIAEVPWPSAAESYDRALTESRAEALARAGQADRERLRSGERAQLGAELDALFRQPGPQAFISHDAFEVAVRLRQLACAARTGTLAPETADSLLGHALVDLESLHPRIAGGAGGRATAP
jgi:hypothetical protein